ASEAGAQVAALGGAAGSSPVAWTEVKGRTDAGNTVDVNGVLANMAADGAFTAEVPLQVGENNIVVTAREPQGVASRASLAVVVADRDAEGRKVVIEEAIPDLTLYLPPNGVALQSNALLLAGKTKPGNRLVVNGDTVAVRADGSFDHRMLLAEGA